MGNMTLLWQQYHQGSIDAKNKIIETYTNLVNIIVGRLCVGEKYGIFDKDDLCSYGIIGLIEAIERFNPNQGVKFETFASLRIRGHIIDNIRRANWLPKDIKKSIKELEQAYEQLSAASLPLTDDNVMKILDIDKSRLDKILIYAGQENFVYLDNFLDSSEDDRFIDGLADEKISPLEEIIAKQTVIELQQSIKKLGPKEQLVLNMYYIDELTLKEIGQILDLSEARISQIHTKAILRLKGLMNTLNK